MTSPDGAAPAPLHRFPVVLTLFVLVALAILMSLGVWQMHRLKWKEGLLHQIAALESAPAQPLAAVLARQKSGGDAAFTRVRTSCPDLETRPVLRLFTVIGVLRGGGERSFVTPPNQPGQNQWYWRDVAAMAKALNARDPAPLYLMLESPAPGSGEPRPSPLPPNLPNNHLGYAITWFGLAGALVGVYLAMLFRKRQS